MTNDIGSRGVGEFILRFARDRGDRKHRKSLAAILRNEDRKFIAGKLLEEKATEELGEGFSFTELIKWMIENPEKVKAFIQMIMELFASAPT